ncbi:4543_t:CDS:10, partial [Racocetra persica]
MQEKAKHLQDKVVRKEEKKQAKEKQKVQYERENKRDENSSSAHPSRESNKVIIDNEIYEPTNIQLDQEQADIARQQYLVPVGFGLVALINSFGYWVFRKNMLTSKERLRVLSKTVADNYQQVAKESDIKTNKDEQSTNKKEAYLKNYPLHYAVAQGDLGKVKEILQSKTVEVDDKDHNNFTPLHIAVGRENHNIVIELLQHGADPNTQDDEGSTPMHSAAEGNNLKLLNAASGIVNEDRELLLVASNQEHPQEVEIWLQHLKQFAEEPDCRKKIYKKLVKLAIKNTCFFIERKLEEDKKQKLENEVNFDKEKKRKEILTEAKTASDKMKEEGLVNSPDENVHAEIKIVSNIYEFNKRQGKLSFLSILKNFCLLRSRKEHYIGISKLACGPCQESSYGEETIQAQIEQSTMPTATGITPEFDETIRRLAHEQDKLITEMLEEFLAAYLEQNEKKSSSIKKKS